MPDSIEKETTFTPGPWKYGQECIDPEWFIVTIESGLIVANVNAHWRQEANARLIAAAPELYAVVSDFMENPNFRVAVGGNPNAVDELMARARNALAKARGEDRSHEGK